MEIVLLTLSEGGNVPHESSDGPMLYSDDVWRQQRGVRSVEFRLHLRSGFFLMYLDDNDDLGMRELVAYDASLAFFVSTRFIEEGYSFLERAGLYHSPPGTLESFVK